MLEPSHVSVRLSNDCNLCSFSHSQTPISLKILTHTHTHTAHCTRSPASHHIHPFLLLSLHITNRPHSSSTRCQSSSKRYVSCLSLSFLSVCPPTLVVRKEITNGGAVWDRMKHCRVGSPLALARCYMPRVDSCHCHCHPRTHFLNAPTLQSVENSIGVNSYVHSKVRTLASLLCFTLNTPDNTSVVLSLPACVLSHCMLYENDLISIHLYGIDRPSSLCV